MTILHNHLGILVLALAQLVVSLDYCLDGTLPSCLDGSMPQYRGLGKRSSVDSICPKACNPHSNTCDPSTAPTCIFPDPNLPQPRGACACRPGYKATGYADNDASKHWRLPVKAQEHRVWVAEGVKCDVLCNIPWGVESCREVTLIAKECIGSAHNAIDQVVSADIAIPSDRTYSTSDPVYEASFGTHTLLSGMANQTKSNVDTQTLSSIETIPSDMADETNPDETNSDEKNPDETNSDETNSDVDTQPLSSIETISGHTINGTASSQVLSATETIPSDMADETNSDVETLLSHMVDGTASSQVPSAAEILPRAVGLDSKRNVNPSLEVNAHDPALFLRLVEAEAKAPTPFSLDHVVHQMATRSAVDLAKVVAEDASLALDTPSIILTTGDKVGRRSLTNRWAEAAQKKGLESFNRNWRHLVATQTKVAIVIDTRKQPQLCPAIIKSVIDTCKRGVRSQAAVCKQSKKDEIAKCKDDVGRRVDRCKKDSNIFTKPLCEPQRLGWMAGCESQRIDIPLCEFGRLTNLCCEGTRLFAKNMCSAGFSTSEIKKQVQSIQATCSVATALLKGAAKSYLSGQMLGFVTELESVKEIGDTIQIIGKVERTRAEYGKWADALTAAAEGRLKDAQTALGPLASEITTPISATLAWGIAVQALVKKKTDGFLANVTSAVGDIQYVMSATKTIEHLKTVTKDIKAIQAAAKECAKVPKNITPPEFRGWERVKSEKDIDAAVVAYEQFYAAKMFSAAGCRAVVLRAGRALKA